MVKAKKLLPSVFTTVCGSLDQKGNANESQPHILTLLHSEQPKLYGVSAVLSAVGLNKTSEVLLNHLGGLSLPRKSVIRLTDPPDMTLAV